MKKLIRKIKSWFVCKKEFDNINVDELNSMAYTYFNEKGIPGFKNKVLQHDVKRIDIYTDTTYIFTFMDNDFIIS